MKSTSSVEGEITVTSEVRTLADGTVAEGLPRSMWAWARRTQRRHGAVAGVGRPSEAGWTWESANDAAGRVADAIAILKNEKVASFWSFCR